MNDESPKSRQVIPLNAGAKPLAIIPTDLDSAFRLAKYVHASGLASHLRSEAAVLVAIMTALELGLPPLTGINKIAVINGRPTIWGDLAMALVRASGKCEYVKERIDGIGDNMVAHCEAKRIGQGAVCGSFSVEDAKQARLWDQRERVPDRRGTTANAMKPNDSPWFRFPKRMLTHRARYALKDAFADVLGGLSLREEFMDGGEQEMIDVTPPKPRHEPPPFIDMGPDVTGEPPPPPPQDDPPPPPPPSPFGEYDERLRVFDLAANSVGAQDELLVAWEKYVRPWHGEAPDDVRAEADAIFEAVERTFADDD